MKLTFVQTRLGQFQGWEFYAIKIMILLIYKL